ncbi:MAG: BatA domain-containing protein [Planctomycetia bacterium]
MTFLQPAILLALPLVALPVIIHLINQRRFQSVEWAAMMFLRSARALSRGYTRLRRWLIMLLRMAAVAAAVVAVSRPLSQGWLAAAGGDRGGTAIVLVDRSPSMAQASGPGGESKLATARRQVAAALESLGTSRTILIDSVSSQPVELTSPKALLLAMQTEQADAAADLPRMMQAACEVLAGSEAGAATIWICSDQRATDWKPADAAWEPIRATLSSLPQSVRLTLLGYPQAATDNLAVRVVDPVLEPRGASWQLAIDIVLRRMAAGPSVRVPVQIELGRARSTVEIELTGTEAILARHTIPIDADALAEAGDPAKARGWGRVSIPADDNPADNEFFFSFCVPQERRSVIVADDSQSRQVLRLAAGIAPDKMLRAVSDSVDANTIATTPLDDVALILWQAALPHGDAEESLGRFVDRGGQIIFLPPDTPSQERFAGLAWGSWSEHSPPIRPASWRAEEGLLGSTRSGAALPVGELDIRRTCRIEGTGTPLAVLPDGSPLLVRAGGDRDGVYFLATTPSSRDSDLASNGIVLYAVIQRAIDDGLAAVGIARQSDAGTAMTAGSVPGSRSDEWRQVDGPTASSTEAGFHAGVYATGSRLTAVNRPTSEDATDVVADRQIDSIFQGLRFSRFEQKAGDTATIIEEVWRLFLAAVLVALIVEGLLCLPARIRLPPIARTAGVAA